jgi:hypothetical protein
MKDAELVTVGIETSLGAHYSFPDMERGALDRLVMRDDNNKLLLESLLLTNVSRAVLTLPSRIIKKITVNGEDWWLDPS